MLNLFGGLHYAQESIQFLAIVRVDTKAPFPRPMLHDIDRVRQVGGSGLCRSAGLSPDLR